MEYSGVGYPNNRDFLLIPVSMNAAAPERVPPRRIDYMENHG